MLPAPSALARALLDLVLPQACAGCGAPGGTVCSVCRARVAAEVLAFGGPQRWHPTPTPTGFAPCVVAAAYDGVLARLIRAHKDEGRHDLTGILAAILAAAVEAAAPHGAVVLVPVPSRSAAVRARGRTPVHEIAERVGAGGGGRIGVASGLTVARRVRDQARLSAQQRGANLAGVMAVQSRSAAAAAAWGHAESSAPTARVLIVDDVVTTGATLVEAARALRSAGVPVMGAVAVCARRRHVVPAAGALWRPD